MKRIGPNAKRWYSIRPIVRALRTSVDGWLPEAPSLFECSKQRFSRNNAKARSLLVDGICFYAIEDLIWPDGQGEELCNFMKLPFSSAHARFMSNHPGPQPIALRHLKDAERYLAAGNSHRNIFLGKSEDWVGHLADDYIFYSGPRWQIRSPAALIQSLASELRFVVGAEISCIEKAKNHVSLMVPEKRFHLSYRRQVRELLKLWNDNAEFPTSRWVAETLKFNPEDHYRNARFRNLAAEMEKRLSNTTTS